jgi:hypothetical protein
MIQYSSANEYGPPRCRACNSNDKATRQSSLLCFGDGSAACLFDAVVLEHTGRSQLGQGNAQCRIWQRVSCPHKQRLANSLQFRTTSRAEVATVSGCCNCVARLIFALAKRVHRNCASVPSNLTGNQAPLCQFATSAANSCRLAQIKPNFGTAMSSA